MHQKGGCDLFTVGLKLGRKVQYCLQNCSTRFLDASERVVRELSKSMRVT